MLLPRHAPRRAPPIDFGRPVETWKMGGTIATRQSDNGTRLPDRRVAAEPIASADSPVRYLLDYPVDSSNLTLALQARALQSLVHHPSPQPLTNTSTTPVAGPVAGLQQRFDFPKVQGPGVVISHGTDTLAETAGLSAYLNVPQVVVYTGSFASPGESGSDARDNLRRSRILAQDDATPPGVYAVIGRDIHLASRLVKVNTHPWDPHHPDRTGARPYFESVDGQPVGTFDADDRVEFRRAFLEDWQHHWQRSSSQLLPTGPLTTIQPAYVESVYLAADSPLLLWQQLINRLQQQEAPCGAVVTGELNKHPQWPRMQQQINTLKAQDRWIVLADDVAGQGPTGKTLTPAQLRTKLSAVLGQAKTAPDVRSFITQALKHDLAGEWVDTHRVTLPLVTPNAAFRKQGVLVQAFPGMTSQVIDDAVVALRQLPHRHPMLLINGFGDGHVPIGTLTLEQRLRQGLDRLHQNGTGLQLLATLKQHKDNPDTWTLPDARRALATVTHRPPAEVDRYLAQVLGASDPMLDALRRAVAGGINVQMGIQPVYGVVNLKAYEIGTLLQLVGVQPLNTTTAHYLQSFNVASS